MTRTCKHCGVDISSRDPIAKQCFGCLEGWAKKTGAAKAYAAVAAAIRKGKLQAASTQKCADCGGQAIDYDHRDYGKPLQVQAVCRSCNKRRGPAITALIATKPVKEAAHG